MSFSFTFRYCRGKEDVGRERRGREEGGREEAWLYFTREL